MWKTISTIMMTSALIVGATGTATAHDWYEKDCCHNKDCAPILREDKETVTTIHGTARKSTLMIKPERRSKDYNDHACIIHPWGGDAGGSVEPAVRCIYRGSAS